MVKSLAFLVLSFSRPASDGRLRALLRVCSKIGSVTLLAPSSYSSLQSVPADTFLTLPSIRDLPAVLGRVSKLALALYAADVVVVDNRRAALLAILLMPFLIRKKRIYDMREFYELRRSSSLMRNIGTLAERIFISFGAHIVICASVERSRFLNVMWGKKKEILVLENRRQFPEPINMKDLVGELGSQKYEYFRSVIESDVTNIISTDGLAHERGIGELIQSISEFGPSVHLHIFGHPERDGSNLQDQIDATQNVTFYSPISMAALRFVSSKMDIGLVRYPKTDRNNKFCASGKIYEFIFSGVPVLTSSNPPLRKLVRDYKFGVSADNLIDGIEFAIPKLKELRKNIVEYQRQNSVSDYETSFASKLSILLKDGADGQVRLNQKS